jgi:hypothetical protein
MFYVRPRKWVFESYFILFGSNFVVFAQILMFHVGYIKLCCVGSNFGVLCWLMKYYCVGSMLAQILLCWPNPCCIGSNFVMLAQILSD